jgi:hypothetical protein
MVDSHLMLSAMKIWHKIRYNYNPERQAEDAAMRARNISAPCGGCAKSRAAGKGAQQKE